MRAARSPSAGVFALPRLRRRLERALLENALLVSVLLASVLLVSAARAQHAGTAGRSRGAEVSGPAGAAASSGRPASSGQPASVTALVNELGETQNPRRTHAILRELLTRDEARGIQETLGRLAASWDDPTLLVALLDPYPAAVPALIETARRYEAMSAYVVDRRAAAAVQALGRIANPAALEFLREQVGRDGQLRFDAMLALGASGDSRALATLRPLVAHADEDVRVRAIDALGLLDQPAAQALIAPLARNRDASVVVRIAALRALRSTPETRELCRELATEGPTELVAIAASRLLRHDGAGGRRVVLALLRSRDPDRVVGAVRALAEEHDEESERALLPLLDDARHTGPVGRALVARASAAGIGRLVTMARGHDPQALEVLQFAPAERRVRALMRELATRDRPEERGVAIAWLARNSDPRVVPVLLELIAHGTQGQRWEAMAQLGSLGVAEARVAFQRFIQEGSESERILALSALPYGQELGEPYRACVRELLEGSSLARAAAVGVLDRMGSWGRERAVEVIAGADLSPELGFMAFDVLRSGELTPAAHRALRRMAQNTTANVYVRAGAVGLLGSEDDFVTLALSIASADPSGTPAVIGASCRWGEHDTCERVAQAILDDRARSATDRGMALANLLNSVTVERRPLVERYLHASEPALRLAALQSVSDVLPTQQAREALLEALDDPNQEVQQTAWVGLVQSDPQAARGLLVRVLRRNDPMAETAAWSVADLGDVELVRRLMNDTSLSLEIRFAIAQGAGMLLNAEDRALAEQLERDLTVQRLSR